MDPPWIACPDIPSWPGIGWRMGGGEDYLHAFGAWFRALDLEARAQFRQTHPEPPGFEGLYAMLLERG